MTAHAHRFTCKNNEENKNNTLRHSITFAYCLLFITYYIYFILNVLKREDYTHRIHVILISFCYNKLPYKIYLKH